MDMEDARHWLALARSPGSRATLGTLLDEHGTPAALFTAKPTTLRAAGLDDAALAWFASPDWARIDADLEWLAASGTTLLVRGAPDYPPLLALAPDPPLVLFVRGRADVLALPALAIVGSRNPTAPGRRDAEAFAATLGGAGFTIVSGLALGIDAAAHQGALAAEAPTVAVCATGLDRVYPSRHRELAHRIAAQGALLSEFAPGTPPLKHHFPLRNRIIAGLSLGTLVVEAAAQSGSLITARLAGEAGRGVFALPGSIHNPLAKGCHRLIRDGATLVESAADVVAELGDIAGIALAAAAHPKSAPRNARLVERDDASLADDAERARVIAEVDWAPTSIDQIVTRSGLPMAVVSSTLLMLELQGRVAAQAGGRYVRINAPRIDPGEEQR
jgi:DNA processing protein